MADHSVELGGICARLQVMRAMGYEFAADHDTDGSITAVVGVRVHRGVIDIFELYGEDDAIATRMPDSEPNIMLARTVLWHTHGRADIVIDDLLGLPDPARARHLVTVPRAD